MYPSVAVEEHRVQAGHQLHLIAEAPGASPQRDACVVPRRRQDGVLALGTIDGEKVERLVVGVVQAYRHHDVPYLNIKRARELLVDPELLQLYLAAFLLLAFPLGSLVGFVLDGAASAGVFKLHLHTEGPAATEVVAQIDDGVRDVEASVRRVVLVVLGSAVAVDVVAVEHAAQGHLAIAADRQALAIGMGHHAVTGRLLCCCWHGKCCHGECHHCCLEYFHKLCHCFCL